MRATHQESIVLTGIYLGHYKAQRFRRANLTHLNGLVQVGNNPYTGLQLAVQNAGLLSGLGISDVARPGVAI